jgi:pilus assembly protein CpaE
MTPDPSVADAVSSALQSNGHVLTGPTTHDMRDLLSQLGRAATPIVLVDLDPQPQQVLPQLERLVSRFPTSRFVALSTTLENDLLMEAMQTGVRRVVVKRTMGTELRLVLDRLTAADLAQHRALGRALTVLSASGGCGATTLAVNLAQEMALEQKQPTLLCDLDCCYGAVASYLGIKPRYAADHVLNYAGPIDGNLIRSTATAHTDHLHLLASPSSSNFAGVEPLKFDRLEQAVESAREAYANVVIDAPRLAMDVAATLVSGSSQTLLVFQLTVKDLRTARATLDALRDRGVDSTSVIPVANRFVKRQMIGLDEASKALGGFEISPVRNDYAPAIQGWNYGQCLSEAGPRSAIRRDLQALLSRLNEKNPA